MSAIDVENQSVRTYSKSAPEPASNKRFVGLAVTSFAQLVLAIIANEQQSEAVKGSYSFYTSQFFLVFATLLFAFGEHCAPCWTMGLGFAFTAFTRLSTQIQIAARLSTQIQIAARVGTSGMTVQIIQTVLLGLCMLVPSKISHEVDVAARVEERFEGPIQRIAFGATGVAFVSAFIARAVEGTIISTFPFFLLFLAMYLPMALTQFKLDSGLSGATSSAFGLLSAVTISQNVSSGEWPEIIMVLVLFGLTLMNCDICAPQEKPIFSAFGVDMTWKRMMESTAMVVMIVLTILNAGP